MTKRTQRPTAAPTSSPATQAAFDKVEAALGEIAKLDADQLHEERGRERAAGEGRLYNGKTNGNVIALADLIANRATEGADLSIATDPSYAGRKVEEEAKPGDAIGRMMGANR